jgi:hypothetical protein
MIVADATKNIFQKTPNVESLIWDSNAGKK